MVRGRISSKKGASRTKTYLYQTNTKQLDNLTERNINKLILKNGSTGINIRIDSFLAINFNKKKNVPLVHDHNTLKECYFIENTQT